MSRKKIILLPGMMSDARLWQPQTDALAADYDIEIKFFREFDSLKAMAANIVSSVTGSFAVIGTSMGGYLAQEVAMQAGARLTHLGLFNTNPFKDPEDRTVNRLKEVAEGEQAFINHRQSDDYFKVFLAAAHKNNPSIINTLRDQSLDFGYKTLINHHEACAGRGEKTAFLKDLTIPVTALGGIEDVVTPIEGQFEIARNCRNCRLVILNDCGHIATLEQPEDVTIEIKKLMNR